MLVVILQIIQIKIFNVKGRNRQAVRNTNAPHHKVLAAMKNAFDNADKESSEKMKSITGGMPNIPGF